MGPWADELEVRRVEGRMRGVEKGRVKRAEKGMGKGERERDGKLREGLRRQREGVGMCDRRRTKYLYGRMYGEE